MLEEEGFSKEVVEAVMLLSRPPEGTPNRPTHAEYVQAIRLSKNPIAISVKRADLVDNLMRINELPSEQQNLRKRYQQGMRILEGA
jgi:hypothetical protein